MVFFSNISLLELVEYSATSVYMYIYLLAVSFMLSSVWLYIVYNDIP